MAEIYRLYVKLLVVSVQENYWVHKSNKVKVKVRQKLTNKLKRTRKKIAFQRNLQVYLKSEIFISILNIMQH
jgi:sensor domain CHASE-containing protein